MIKAPNNNNTIVGKPAADIAKDFTKKWHPCVKSLFNHMQESEAAFWKIKCSDPKGVPEWPDDPRITLMGDAVHAMTPADGNEANTVIKDAALLCRLLAEAGGFKEGMTGVREGDARLCTRESAVWSEIGRFNAHHR